MFGKWFKKKENEVEERKISLYSYEFYLVAKERFEVLRKKNYDIFLERSSIVGKEILEFEVEVKLSKEELQEIKEMLWKWLKEDGYDEDKYMVVYEEWEV